MRQLVGERWQYIGRAGDIVWAGFGAPRVVTSRDGTPRQVAEYALHIECPWRMFDGDEIVTGSRDMYQPKPDWTGDHDDFQWDVQGANRFDARAAKLSAYLAEEPVVVTSTEVTAWGDLTISFSDGLRINTLRTGSMPREEWRFFRPYREHDHVVVFAET